MSISGAESVESECVASQMLTIIENGVVMSSSNEERDVNHKLTCRQRSVMKCPVMIKRCCGCTFLLTIKHDDLLKFVFP